MFSALDLIPILAIAIVGVPGRFSIASTSSEGNPADTIVVRSDVRSNDEKIVISTVGDTIQMECEFSFKGWTYVQWLKLRRSEDSSQTVTTKPMQSNETFNNGSVLVSAVTLENVDEKDAGNYSCISTSSKVTTLKFIVAVKGEKLCAESPCSPNGRCVELRSGYTCNCDEGFVGKNCQMPDPCLDSPCMNGGMCTVVDEEFNCTCPKGFGGKSCQNQVCTGDSCQNNGVCSDDTGKIECTCTTYYAGDRCQHRCNNLYRERYNSNYCARTCVINQHGYYDSCQCDYNRNDRSRRCMMSSEQRNECTDPNICNGRGSCVDQMYKYRCNCRSYSSGTNCEFLNECRLSNNLCNLNGGTCVDLPVGYKCTCPEDQYGDNCQHKDNPCNVTCGQTEMTAECDMRFLDKKLRTIPIYLNLKSYSCRFRANEVTGYYNRGRRDYMRRRKSISYDSCGTEVQYGDEEVIYRNYLRSGLSTGKDDDVTGIITRAVGYFSFKMECKMPLLREVSKNINDVSLARNQTKVLKDEEEIAVVGTALKFYDENWRNTMTQYVVGDRLYVEMTVNRNGNPTLSQKGAKLLPVDCYATPSNSSKESEGRRYAMIKNGCILGKTLRFENKTSSSKLASYFSFDSFSFKSNPGKLFLHCTARICFMSGNETVVEESDCEVACGNMGEAQEETTAASKVLRTMDGYPTEPTMLKEVTGIEETPEPNYASTSNGFK